MDIKRIMLFLLALALLFSCGCSSGGENAVVEVGLPSEADGSSGRAAGGAMPEGMPRDGANGGERPSGGGRAEGSAAGNAYADAEKQSEKANGSSADANAGGASAAAGASVIGRVESIVGNRATLLIGSMTGDSVVYGEETEAYLLPVGMAIGTGDFSSVAKGMVLRLSFESEGSDVITAVSVISR